MKGLFLACAVLGAALTAGCIDNQTSPVSGTPFGSFYDGEAAGPTNSTCTLILPVPILHNATWAPLNLSTPTGTTMKTVWTTYGKAIELQGTERVALGGVAKTSAPTQANLSLQAGGWNATPGSQVESGRFNIWSQGCNGYQFTLQWQYDSTPQSMRVDMNAILGDGWELAVATLSPETG
ncbi:MAG: hypothetical protein ACYDDF_08810 [Thermoplasmatota archaeon]